MRQNLFVKSFSLVLVLFFSNFFLSLAQSSNGINVNLNVGGCNNNGICDSGEDIYSCPADCTPPSPPSPPAPTTGRGGRPPIEEDFNNLRVEVSYKSATIKWNSTVPTISSIKWGLSSDYREGALRNVNYLMDHKVEIGNLQDGTIYYFTIQAESALGRSSSIDSQFFRTLSLPDTIPPSNPTNVRAYSSLAGITVSWINPKDADFDYIRVMRNEGRFYGSPNVGHLVYEGKGSYFTDAGVKVGTKYFYSLFSRDKTGNYSSGALVSIIHKLFGGGTDEGVPSVPVVPSHLPTGQLTPIFDMYVVKQGSSVYDFNEGKTISLNGDEPILIKTNYSIKTKNDDTWIEIINLNREIVGQYLFSRIPDEDGFIQVDIPVFENSGTYGVNVYRYIDGLPQLVNQGSFNISKAVISENKAENGGDRTMFFLFILIIILLILLILVIILSRYFKQKKTQT